MAHVFLAALRMELDGIRGATEEDTNGSGDDSSYCRLCCCGVGDMGEQYEHPVGSSHEECFHELGARHPSCADGLVVCFALRAFVLRRFAALRLGGASVVVDRAWMKSVGKECCDVWIPTKCGECRTACLSSIGKLEPGTVNGKTIDKSTTQD